MHLFPAMKEITFSLEVIFFDQASDNIVVVENHPELTDEGVWEWRFIAVLTVSIDVLVTVDALSFDNAS
jgi:hypothetical protein